MDTTPPVRKSEGRPAIPYPSIYGATLIHQGTLNPDGPTDGPHTAPDHVRDLPELIARLKAKTNSPDGNRDLMQALIALMADVTKDEGLDDAINDYEPAIGNRDTEKRVLKALNVLIAGTIPDATEPPFAEAHTLLTRLATRIKGGQLSDSLAVFQAGNGMRRSAEHRYLWCKLGHGSSHDALQIKQRFNRVVIEDIFRRAFAKSINLSFHLAFLDDEIPDLGDATLEPCKPPSTALPPGTTAVLKGAHRLCGTPPDLDFRRPLVPGDVVTMTVSGGLSVNPSKPEFPTDKASFGQQQIVIRYLPETIASSRVREETRFIDLSINAMHGSHEPIAGSRSGDPFEVGLGRARAGGAHAALFHDGFPAFWNALIDPSIGILSQESLKGLDGRSPLSSRFLRVMLNHGPQPERGVTGCHSGASKTWWHTCPNNIAPFDNDFEDRFIPTYRICPKGDIHDNLLVARSSNLDRVPPVPGKKNGLILHTEVERGRVDWATNRYMRHPWSLREWEASRILGAFEPEITALKFPGGAIDGGPFPTRDFSVSIAWPGDDRPITVALVRDEDTGVVSLSWLDTRYPKAPRVMSYRDLRYLARPPHIGTGKSDDRVEQYLADVPIAIALKRHSHRLILVAPDEPVEDLRDGALWDDTAGFNDELGGRGHSHKHFAPRADVLQSVAAYAISIDGWARYRLPAPDVKTEINALTFDDGEHYAVTEFLYAATHRVIAAPNRSTFGHGTSPRNTMSGSGIVVQSGYYLNAANPTCAVPDASPSGFCPHPHDTGPKKIFWRDLELLNAFHVGKVFGLTNDPLPGLIAERQP